MKQALEETANGTPDAVSAAIKADPTTRDIKPTKARRCDDEIAVEFVLGTKHDMALRKWALWLMKWAITWLPDFTVQYIPQAITMPWPSKERSRRLASMARIHHQKISLKRFANMCRFQAT